MTETEARDLRMMTAALEEAAAAAAEGEIPVGAVMARGDEIIARCHNLREKDRRATAHAELLCIEEANRKLGGWRLPGCTLYVTLEPCPMCAGAIVNARVPEVVYALKDAKAGALGSVLNLTAYPLNFKPKVRQGPLAAETAALLRSFFSLRR